MKYAYIIIILFLAVVNSASAAFYDDFNDGNLDGWSLVSGSTAWGAANYNATVHTDVYCPSCSSAYHESIATATIMYNSSNDTSWNVKLKQQFSYYQAWFASNAYTEFRFISSATAWKSIRIYWAWPGGGPYLCLLYDSVSGCASTVSYTDNTDVNVMITKLSTVYHIIFYKDDGTIITTYDAAFGNNIANADRMVLVSYTNVQGNDGVQDRWINQQSTFDNIQSDQITNIGDVKWNAPTYKNYNTANISFVLNSPNFIDNYYRIQTRNTVTGAVMNTWMLAASSGTINEPLTNYGSGTYYAVLSMSPKVNVNYSDYAYDLTQITAITYILGTTYNAETASVLDSVSIFDYQANTSTWFNTTSASDGTYSLYDLTANVPVNVNASKVNYTHVNFTWTPLSNSKYIQNLYLFPNNITRSSGGVEGVVIDSGVYQVISGATVTISNGTYQSSKVTNSTGFYSFSGLSNGAYTITAASGDLTNAMVYSVTISSQTQWEIQNIVLTITYKLTVKAQDATTTVFLNNFQVCNLGSCTSTTSGTVYINLGYGFYYITVSSDGYYTAADWVLMYQDTSKTFQLAINPVSQTQQTLFKTLPHDVRIIFTSDTFGTQQLIGVYVTAQGYNTTVGTFEWLSILRGVDFNVTPIANISMNGYTGSDGAINFMMFESVYYQINASKSGYSNFSYWLYPSGSTYYFSMGGTAYNYTQNDVNYQVNTTVLTKIINDTHAYVNLTYIDGLNETLTNIIYLNQSNASNPQVQTNLQSYNCGTNATCNASFIVQNYGGTDYLVNDVFTHTTFGSQIRSSGVHFRGLAGGDIGIPLLWLAIFAISTLVFSAAFFGQSSREIGSALVCVLAWIYIEAGFFDYFGTSGTVIIVAGTSVATFVSAFAVIRKRQQVEGIA